MKKYKLKKSRQIQYVVWGWYRPAIPGVAYAIPGIRVKVRVTDGGPPEWRTGIYGACVHVTCPSYLF